MNIIYMDILKNVVDLFLKTNYNIVWGRNGFDWARRIFCARKRAAWLFKNAETIIANDNVAFDLPLAA